MDRKHHDPNKISFAPEQHLLLAKVLVGLVILQEVRIFHLTVIQSEFSEMALPS